MKPILINDILHFDETDLKNIKIRFNQPSQNEDPLQLYINNHDDLNTRYFLWREKMKYFDEGQIGICLLKLKDDLWLLTTIKRITKNLDKLYSVGYEAEELTEYEPYFGRLVVKFHKTFQSQMVYYGNVHEELEVAYILSDVYDGEDFPGYDKVRVSYQQLANIVKNGNKDWITALENQKDVYLITDKSNGKLYVGSATSNNDMLLSRWKTYIENGHGGNVRLKELVDKKGFDYVKKNFHYSILENYNAKVDDSVILEREAWWKKTLESGKYGYNAN